MTRKSINWDYSSYFYQWLTRNKVLFGNNHLMPPQLRHGGLSHQKLATRPLETGIQSMNKGTLTNGRRNWHHREREDHLTSIDHSEPNG
jgi:hypothetical protein